MYCEFLFQPAPFCTGTFSFQFVKLLSNAAEPGGLLPLTDCAVAERGVFVKDAAKLSVEISDGCDGLGKILFKGVSVNFTDRAELWECQADIERQYGQIRGQGG